MSEYAIVRDLENGLAELIVGGEVDSVGTYDEQAAHARSINADVEADRRNANHEFREDCDRDFRED